MSEKQDNGCTHAQYSHISVLTVMTLWTCYSAATVGHNDGSSQASDWLTPLRWAREAASDWLSAVLASFLGLAVAAPQAARSDYSLYAEGAMLMPGFVSTAALWMVKGLRLEEWEPLRWFLSRDEKRRAGWDGTGSVRGQLLLGHRTQLIQSKWSWC